jgi:hypothetical protein
MCRIECSRMSRSVFETMINFKPAECARRNANRMSENDYHERIERASDLPSSSP